VWRFRLARSATATPPSGPIAIIGDTEPEREALCSI
jgi:hypothetical protein